MRNAHFRIEHFDYRYMVPRNLVQFPKLSRFISRHAHGIYRTDKVIARIPILHMVANALNAVAVKPSE